MADLPTNPAALAAGATLGDGGDGSPPAGQVGGASALPPSDLARRARAWFLEASQSPLWTDYIRESTEDTGYYVGGEGQWVKEGSKQDLERLKAQRRAIISINHCKPIVDVLVGFENQNAFDIKAVPQGDEDDEDARILSWLLKFIQDQAEVGEGLSEAFKYGLIRGLSALAIEVDWMTDPVNGEIVCERLTPGRDIIWDPNWRKYDLSDAAYVLRFKWVRVDDLVAQYPEYKTEIMAAVSMLHDTMAPYDPRTTDGPARDAYGTVNAPVIEPAVSVDRQFYDPALRRIMVVEPWHLTYEPKHLVTDKVKGKVQKFDSADVARQFAASDRKNLTYVRKLERHIRTGVVLPATAQTLEETDTPYDNDPSNYPFVPYVADKIDDVIMGIVRNIKDPQRVENKRVSQAMDIVARYCNLRAVAEENSLVNPDALKDPYDTSVIWVRPGKKPPGFLVPDGLAQIVNVLVELSQQMKTAPREVSGVNTDLLGIRGDTSSGIAIARRQAQGQVIATPYFTNLRRTRKLVGQRLARRIQQRFPTEQIMRLIDDTGQPVTVRVNPVGFGPETFATPEAYRSARQAERDAGRPHILRDPSALKFDVVIAEGPSTPTARQGSLLMLEELVKAAPQILPAVIDVMLELADVPQRPKILQRLEMIINQQFGGGVPSPQGTVGPAPGAAPRPATSSVATAPPGPPVPPVPSPAVMPGAV